MQTSSDSSMPQPPSPRGPSVQWIGVHWQGGYYAIPLARLTAVFKTQTTATTGRRAELDIQVHDGAPVFMRSFSNCFDLSAHPAPPNPVEEELKWALILNVPGTSPLGCRVHQVVGPFWDELKSSAVHHDGQDWLLVQVSGSFHA